MIKSALPIACLILGAGCLAADDTATPLPEDSVNNVMLNTITPASNTLWGVEDPSTDAEWQELADAALLIIEAVEQLRHGGSGPNDKAWAADSAYQTFLDTLGGAAVDAQNAAGEKDLDALLNANDVLYPPCEECHVQFHPGVSGEDTN